MGNTEMTRENAENENDVHWQKMQRAILLYSWF